jgi:hypothetical protein
MIIQWQDGLIGNFSWCAGFAMIELFFFQQLGYFGENFKRKSLLIYTSILLGSALL